jgi:hypothetical protein
LIAKNNSKAPEGFVRILIKEGQPMDIQEKAGFSGKHEAGAMPNETVRRALAAYGEKGEISCAAAFTIARDLGVSPREVGRGADLMNIHLVKCQLGLFGYKPKKKIVTPLSDTEPALVSAVREALLDGRLSCSAAWELASRFSVSKMTVSGVCEEMGIKIKPCQLGAF